jgi:hypothetical protein
MEGIVERPVNTVFFGVWGGGYVSVVESKVGLESGAHSVIVPTASVDQSFKLPCYEHLRLPSGSGIEANAFTWV